MLKKHTQIHATNINGLGASQVVISFLKAAGNINKLQNANVFLTNRGLFYSVKAKKVIFFRRILPNSLSRLIECFFSTIFFENIPTIVLGDIPLRGLRNQVVLVHQSNLVYPSVNNFSSNSFKFKINRLLFSLNHQFAKKIVVQTVAMAEELIQSYPSIRDKVVVIPQPYPNWLDRSKKLPRTNVSKLHLFYPAAFYPHKKHDFLLNINDYCIKKSIKCIDFEVWLTLEDDDFIPYRNISFVKNLGRLNSVQMNEYYQKADALLFLSCMESYGLPLIEALTINLPIIVADFRYARWVCEDSVYYFKPYSEKSLLEAITIFRKDCNQKKQVDYLNALNKFPKEWEQVVEKFYYLLDN